MPDRADRKNSRSALAETERNGAAATARCARCRTRRSFGTLPCLRPVEGRNRAARQPTLTAEPEPREKIDRLPVKNRFAQPKCRDRPRVEPGPRQERIAASHCPDLDTGGRLRARAACVKPECVGDDERVGRYRDRLR